MIQSKLEIKPLPHHLEQINEPLLGYWANDVWNVQECPFLDKHYDWNRKLIFDKVHNLRLKNELKYYFYKGLQETRISITYAFMHYSPCLKVFTEFNTRYYVNLDSIIDIQKEKFLTEYRTFLVENGKSVEIVHRKKSSPWLSPTVQPSLYLMEATGFRICDVLSLKIDCLVKQEDGWWIIGNQRKVSYKNHKVPISEEIANVVLAQQELTKKRSTLDTNPKKYLFPILKGTRMGNPISQDSIKLNLNKLANRCNIKDKDGEIYWFKNHAFGHRYGVNLINNGMNILHVQKLMAHASPEMTLVYAQIHDQTLRDEWEKARDNGAVRLDTHGEVVVADLAQQAEENGVELEWIRHNMDSIRLDYGSCVKSPKLHCDFLEQTLEPPCIKNNCRSFHVDKTFLDYYQEQIFKMEADIEVYKKSGRLRSIELIEPKLKRYKELASGLLHTGGIFGLDKTRREYVGDEREKVETFNKQ
ncbi:site-specific integrase [Cytobacillus sp. S13-E01]|uniref:tyrosine-type recombinase/integrase n=1 Tax=Cytobacillus sp. S13-E01 TaxID=3031326 RepID=UPI0023D7C03D|nr:site-specific integrase [Cytobacillus sp. S13-E01]MDF0727711.1 site-specific integrase [Cytobacillus sp. S13-E01]